MGAVRTLLVFFEGAADVLVVIVALDLLDIGEGKRRISERLLGVGALLAVALLAMMLARERLATGLVAEACSRARP